MFHAFAHDITNARRAVRFADVEVALALGLRPDHRLSRRRHRYRHPPHCERPRLFRRLYRASTALDQPIPGTALGLVITRTIVERHHGAIALAEHTGPGTTFVV
ncbi:ATP-binding protein [Actinoplanes italicus]